MGQRLLAGALVATVSVVAIASAIWLLPASVHIVSWGPTGPVRVAFLAPLSRLFLALIFAGAFAVVATAGWQASGRPFDELVRRALPLAWLLLWLLPFLPWLPDRAPLLLVFAGPLRWAVAAVSIMGVLAAVIGGAAAPSRGGTRWAVKPLAATRPSVAPLRGPRPVSTTRVARVPVTIAIFGKPIMAHTWSETLTASSPSRGFCWA